MTLLDTLNTWNCTTWLLLPDRVNKITNNTIRLSGTDSSKILPGGMPITYLDGNTYLDLSEVPLNSEFTVGIWVYAPSDIAYVQNREYTLFNTANNSESSYETLKLLSKIIVISGVYSVRLYPYFNCGQSNATLSMSTSYLEPDTWYFISATHTDSQSKIYINGRLKSTNTTVVHLNTEYHNNKTIGCSCIGKNNFYKGYLDRFFLFNQVLTSDQMLKLYNLQYRKFQHKYD